MNEPNNKAGHYRPTEEEVATASLEVADRLLGFASRQLDVHGDREVVEDQPGKYNSWCPNAREQVGYEAACLVLGLMDGVAACRGVSRRSLDKSLRNGLRIGRTIALEAHKESPCDGKCDNASTLLRLLEASKGEGEGDGGERT